MRYDKSTNISDFISRFIEKTRRLTPAEDCELFKIMRESKGSKLAERAREILYNCHLADLFSMIKDYNHASIERNDIYNTAALALGKAIDTYNPNLQASLYTHTSWQVRGALSKLIKESELLHIPSNKQDERRKLKIQTNKGKSLSEIEMDTLKKLDIAYVSTSATLTDNSDTIFEDILESKECRFEQLVYENEIKRIIWIGMKHLKPMQKDVLIQNFGLDNNKEESLNDIAKTSGTTHQYIGQVKKQALNKLLVKLDKRGAYLE